MISPAYDDGECHTMIAPVNYQCSHPSQQATQ